MKIKEIAEVLYDEFEKSETIVEIGEISPIEDEEIINLTIYDAIDAHERIKADGYDDWSIKEYIYREICDYINYILKKLNVSADFDLDYERADENTICISGTLTIE